MSTSGFGRGLGQLNDVLAQALFPVPEELGLDARTKNALQRRATMELGLGMMAAKDRGAGLGAGLGFALNNAQRGLGANLNQIFAARQEHRQEARQSAIDDRLARAEERGIENDAWNRGFREREFAAGESDRAFDRDYKSTDLKLRERESQRARGAQGTWSQPFEAIDPTTGKPGMFQSHSLTGQIRPAAVGAGQLGPKPKSDGDSTAPDSLIYRQVVGAFGGTFDPVTGTIVGLDKDQASRIQSVNARASRLYADAQGRLQPAEAVDQAMNEAIAGPRNGTKPPVVGALPDAAKARLREGIVTTFANGQKWTVKNGQPVQVQ